MGAEQSGALHLSAGELSEAQRTVSVAPPGEVGFELTTRWQLVQSAASLACGDLAAAEALAASVAETADQKGLKRLAATAKKLVACPSLPASELPRLILINA